MANKILIIVGPTASGKTGLGLLLAKKYNGEIVSADSRQVYKEIDISTGKDIEGGKWITKKGEKGHWEVGGMPIWLLDVVNPSYSFSVADYHDLAHGIIKNIWRREKLPIVVGGTGLYIKAMLDGIDTLGVPPNPKLREAYENKTAKELLDILFHLDSKTAENMNRDDRQNKRRLIRKIEILQSGVIAKKKKEFVNLDPFLIGLTAPMEVLYQKIDNRIDSWVKGGAEKEIKKLIGMGYSWELPAISAIGYRQWKPYFEGKVKAEEVVKRWKFDEHGYARRQLTWFKRDKRIKWFDISKRKWENKVEKLFSKWYHKDAEKD
ncbi:MAG: tRNA (adenosine(37)-N6)-dimethylallyltransferase MiaA [bacterium]|nr:tRNA (adenosine(37)-N6)-dimethylallyltransferase MiaA [bacterium]